MDVCDERSVAQGVAEVVAKARRIDVLVNNAGIGVAGALEDHTLEDVRFQFETNFFGAFRLCREVLPQMRAQGGGLIINVSSMAGLSALPFQSTYSAAKFALEGMSEALRMEVRQFGIDVCLVEPGDFRTGFTASRRLTERARGGSPRRWWTCTRRGASGAPASRAS